MSRKRQKRVVGDIVAVPLRDGAYGFGCVLEEPLVAFFDFRAAHKDIAAETILGKPVAFKIWVMNSAITSGRWPVVGHVDPPREMQKRPRFFKQDPISGALSITYNGGDEIPTAAEECASLECAAVWSAEHVVDRLEDHFAGRPNKWVESLRLR